VITTNGTFVILSFISWPLYCLLFFELRLLINPFDVFKIVVTKTDLTSGDISSTKLHSVKTSLISIFSFDLTLHIVLFNYLYWGSWVCRGRDRVVVGFITTYAITNV
jgi:hypothetical protein